MFLCVFVDQVKRGGFYGKLKGKEGGNEGGGGHGRRAEFTFNQTIYWRNGKMREGEERRKREGRREEEGRERRDGEGRREGNRREGVHERRA